MIRNKFFAATIGLLAYSTTFAQQQTANHKMEWFDDAKLGIFIHWGIYSVNGISESWAFFNNYISHENYLKQLNGFGAEKYDPKNWAELIKKSGAKYTVITTKHHDGIALWDSKAPEALTTLKHAKAKKDLLSPFVKEVKDAGLKTGFYYSLPDWSHAYYDIKTRTQKRYDLKDKPERWSKFVDFYQTQLSELSSRYKPDLLWFDGDWEHTSEEWKAEETLNLLRKYNPNIIINSRLNHHGDYATPEQGIPVVKPHSRFWELCYTMNDSWGFQHFDKNYKTPNMIIRTLVDCIAMGGNLLLDIAPKADGSIPEEQVHILKELGKWTSKHAEAIYETRAGVGFDYLNEKTAFSKDGKTLFVYLEHKKDNITINSLVTKPSRVRQIGAPQDLKFTFTDSIKSIAVDLQHMDDVVTVLALDFDEIPEFSNNIIKTIPKVEKLVRSENTMESIRSIAEWTAYGANPFKGKVMEDGSQLDKQIVFGSEDVKTWVKKHAEVLHDAQKGIDKIHYNGHTALSADKQTLYLFVEGKPMGPIAIKGLKNNIARIRIVGEGTMIGHQVFNKLYWSATPGIVYIDVPAERLDENMTVIAVLLDKPIELYSEEVKAIESNL